VKYEVAGKFLLVGGVWQQVALSNPEGEVLYRGVIAKGGRAPKRKVGDRVGEWTLLSYVPGRMDDGERVLARWRCRCSCGIERNVSSNALNAGLSMSCGHVVAERQRVDFATRLVSS
jgi:hypothetical protein